MNTILKYSLGAAVLTLAMQAGAQITFFENDRFEGRSFTTDRQIDNFRTLGFNDRASSVVVDHDNWEVCDDVGFGGRCAVLRPGRYQSLASMGLNDRVSSVRAVSGGTRIEDRRYAPAPEQAYDYGRRRGERTYQATVTSVHAVVGPPEQRCWVERENIPRERSKANVPAAIAGALIGGILGHQIGGGSGRDIATAGGVVAGAAVGANVGRNGGQDAYTRDVKRCADVPSQARPAFWDVTYTFRGQDYRMQMTSPPGKTVTVNRKGEPRA